MNKYEAMFIFPETVKDSALEETLGNVRAEMTKLGGKVDSTTRLGKRAFARKMGKQDAGHYAIISFSLDPEQIKPLLARYKLDESVFRVQIMRAETTPVLATKKEKADGVAQ